MRLESWNDIETFRKSLFLIETTFHPRSNPEELCGIAQGCELNPQPVSFDMGATKFKFVTICIVSVPKGETNFDYINQHLLQDPRGKI